jgi:hypothetical protein
MIVKWQFEQMNDVPLLSARRPQISVAAAADDDDRES